MRLVEGLAETSLACGAVFNGSDELLGWLGIALIVSRMLS